MARDAGDRTDEKSFLTDRRRYLKTTAAGVAGASLLSSSRLVDSVDAATTTVDLGEQGLSEGDVIDGYLSEYFTDGTEVRVPAGEYEWRGSGLSGSYDGAALVGDGEVSLQFSGQYWNANLFAVGGGDLLVRNITIRGPIDSNDNKSRFRFDARNANSTVRLDNFNLPDGDVGYGRSIGIYVGLQHAGTIHATNCHIEGFPNNGFYAGSHGRSDGGGGRVVVENCFFKDNNIDAIRVGGSGDTVRNCVIVQEDVPAYHNGAKTGRGVRVRYPGDNITIENVHITSDASVPVIVPSRANGPSGEIRNVCVENNTGSTAVFVDSGSWSGDNIHVTGSGNRNVTGFDSVSDVYSGAGAESPVTSMAELEGTTLANSLTIDGEGSYAKAYSFTVSGDLDGRATNPDDDVGEESVDGHVWSSADQYAFSGEVTALTVEEPENTTVRINGVEVDPADFASEPSDGDSTDGSTGEGSSGDDSTDDGSTGDNTTEDGSNDDDSTDDGTDSTEDGSLEHTLTVDGTTDTEKAYYFEVSGELQEDSSINPDDTVNASSVEGTMYSGSDSYEFSGEVETFESDALDELTVYVDGSRIDPTQFDSLPNTLTIEGDGSYAKAYSFEVSGELNAEATNQDDTVNTSSVDGHVWAGSDRFTFSGEVTDLTVEEAENTVVRVNGVEVDPADFGSDPLPHRLVLDGTTVDGPASYAFEVSDAVEKSADLGELEDDDVVDGTAVEGSLENDLDGYRFAGDLVSMHVDGSAVITIEQTEE